ncbi:MAG TPA: DUF4352 domain-containing protein [Pseudonocardia sp.]|jgi:hypothetical protein
MRGFAGPASAIGRPAVALILALLVGCAPTQPPAAPPTPTYQLPPRPVRPEERPLAVGTVKQGNTEFTPIGLSSLEEVVGSHAEWEPKGQFIRVRLVVVNTDRSSVSFTTAHQQLITTDGAAHDVDSQAMLIERQPDEPFNLGAFVRIEFDLYYDVPVNVRPKALRVHGGTTLTDPTDSTSADIPLDR